MYSSYSIVTYQAMSSSVGPMGGFYAALCLCSLHLLVFLLMLRLSRTQGSGSGPREMATYLQETGAVQDEVNTAKMSS